jgi:hypothetical protein
VTPSAPKNLIFIIKKTAAFPSKGAIFFPNDKTLCSFFGAAEKGKNCMHIVDEEKEAFALCAYFVSSSVRRESLAANLLRRRRFTIKRTLEFIYSPMVNHPRNTTHISLVCVALVTLPNPARASLRCVSINLIPGLDFWHN